MAATEIRGRLLLSSSVIGSLKKLIWNEDINLITQARLIKMVIFSTTKYGCESETMKETDRKNVEFFELWRWRKLLRVLWTGERTNETIHLRIGHAILFIENFNG